MIRRYIKNILIGCVDIPLNTLIGGSPYETVSERLYRHREHPVAFAVMNMVDFVFWVIVREHEHCKNAEEGDESQYEIWK